MYPSYSSVSPGILTNRVFVLHRENEAEKGWGVMREGETAGTKNPCICEEEQKAGRLGLSK